MFTNITHLLCGTDFDEKDIGEATDIYDIPSVTGEWVKACVRLGRLVCPKIYHPIPNGLFTSIVAAITELQPNDRKILYALITFNGGSVERNFTPKTTHLICGSPTGSLYFKAIEMKSDSFKLVTPDWLFECLKAQELIDPKPYHPRLLNPSNTNNVRDNRSLSDIIGTNAEIKTVAKKTEILKSISETVTKPVTQQMTMSFVNTSTRVVNTVSTANTSIAVTTVQDTKTKLAESQQSKLIGNSPALQRNTSLNQTLSNQIAQVEQTVKEKMVCDLIAIECVFCCQFCFIPNFH